MVDETIFTAISVYAPKCCLNEEAKGKFYGRLIEVASKVGEEVLAAAGDQNSRAGKTSGGFEEVYGGNGNGYGDYDYEKESHNLV